MEGGGGVGELVKVSEGLKKVCDVQGRFPEVNGGECSWKRRDREENRNKAAASTFVFLPPPS